MLSPLVTFLLTQLLFPAAVAIGVTMFISQWVRSHLKNTLTAPALESDLRNEALDPSSQRNAEFLIFALLFNLTYLTVDPTLVNGLLFHSPVLYALALVFFLVGLFVVLTFELRFIPSRYTILGGAFAAAGSVVVLATIRLGFAQGSATGTASGTAVGLIPGSSVGMVLVPIVIIACAWTIAFFALIIEAVGEKWALPFRFPSDRAFKSLTLAVVLGWVGIMIAVIPMAYHLV